MFKNTRLHHGFLGSSQATESTTGAAAADRRESPQPVSPNRHIRIPRRLSMFAASLLIGLVGLITLPGTGGAAFAANPQGFSPYLSHNPRVFTLTGSTCKATVGFIYDEETNWQRIGGVTVSCTSRYQTITAHVVVQYTPAQYYNASTSAYYSPSGVTVSNATAASSTSFPNSLGFGGRILESPGVCRGGASYSIFYVGATVAINGASYNLNSWGYWNPNSGC
jgi:hypothetical protein